MILGITAEQLARALPSPPNTGIIAAMSAVLPYFADATQYLTNGINGGVNVQALTANKQYFAPIAVPYLRSYSQITIDVTTGVAGNARLGLFNLDTTSGGPGTVALDAGEISLGSTGQIVATAPAAVSLAAGFYWLCLWAGSAASVQSWQDTYSNQMAPSLPVHNYAMLSQTVSYSSTPFTDMTGVSLALTNSTYGCIVFGMR